MAKPPTVRLRRLAAELRRLRAAARLSHKDVTERTGITRPTLYRIEKPECRPQVRTLATLLDLYGVGDDQRAWIYDLHKGAETQGWLRPYHEALHDGYKAYIQFESEAATVRNWEAFYVPGLLQTQGYARALIKGHLPDAAPEYLEQRVKARIDRQSVLTKERPPGLVVIVDEAVLHRLVGGPVVMAEQLQRLEDSFDQPHVSLQVVPYLAGAHQGMSGGFILFSFASPSDGEVVYIESLTSDSFLESEADIDRYTTIFEDLRAKALSPGDSLARINKARAELARELETL